MGVSCANTTFGLGFLVQLLKKVTASTLEDLNRLENQVSILSYAALLHQTTRQLYPRSCSCVKRAEVFHTKAVAGIHHYSNMIEGGFALSHDFKPTLD